MPGKNDIVRVFRSHAFPLSRKRDNAGIAMMRRWQSKMAVRDTSPERRFAHSAHEFFALFP